MDSLVTMARVALLDVALANALENFGWSTTKLASLQGEDEDVLDGLVMAVEDVHPGFKVDRNELVELIDAAQTTAETLWASGAGCDDADLAMQSRMSRLLERMNELRREKIQQINTRVPRKGLAPRATWPTKTAKRLALAGEDGRQREGVERSERDRWLKRLRELIREGGRGTDTWGDDLGVLARRMGKGRRAGTLRKHVKVWERYTGWLRALYGVAWPTSPAHFAEYLETRASEPCGRSIPVSLFKTLIFMENSAEVHPDEQISKSLAVKNALEEVVLQLDSNNPSERRQARALPVAVVIAMEHAVMDVGLERFQRAYAWFRLAKIWGAMRHHDTTGLDFASAKLEGGVWSADLRRTKTSGPGKRVSLLKVFISRNAYLVESRWLAVGWYLWQAMAEDTFTAGRDFFLPLPRVGLSLHQRRMASYAAAAAMSQALFAVLQYSDPVEESRLLDDGVGAAWTEHSERVTMRTWAGASGVPEHVCRRLGRWTPTVDQAYDRSVKAQVIAAQEHVATFIQKNLGRRDPFDEAATMAAVSDKLSDVGASVSQVREQVRRLQVFRAAGRECKQVQWRGSTEVEMSSPGEEGPGEGPRGSSEEEPVEAEPTMALGHYVISIVGRAKQRTLHRMGECYRQPGVHYQDYEVFGGHLPPAETYHRSCRICFPKGADDGARAEDSDSEEDSGAASSTSSSSSLE